MNAEKYLKPYAIVPVTMDAIRDLVELGKQQAYQIAELEDKLSFYEIKDLDSGSKPKPLSDDEIRKIAIQCDAYDNDGSLITDDICIDKFARAIEERHGIK